MPKTQASRDLDQLLLLRHTDTDTQTHRQTLTNSSSSVYMHIILYMSYVICMYTLTNASSLPLNLNVCIHTYDICQLAGCQEEETALFFFHPKIYNNIIFLSFESFPEDFFMFILFYFICPFFLPAPKNVEEIVTVQDGG